MMPTFDADGYPTPATLHWLHDEGDEPTEALDFLRAAWHWPRLARTDYLTAHEQYVVDAHPGERFLRLVTGGWSGNEDLIEAFAGSMAYAVTWQMSARGGLYIFKYPPVPADRTAR